jgi:hypothetical protein
MNQLDRKALLRQYKETPRLAGIFQVKNLATGRVLVGSSPDVPGMLNRQRFQLEMGSHPDRELQADWNELGPDNFEFAVLDELEPGEDASQASPEDLRVLHALWLERLATVDCYPLTRRGT